MTRIPDLLSCLAAFGLLLASLALVAPAQQAPKAAKKAPAKAAAKTVNPRSLVNYDEAKVGDVKLPELLKMKDGTPVATREDWTKKRRPEILRLIQAEEYGRPPKKLDDLKFEVTSEKKDALGGKATRKIVHISLEKHPAWGGMDLMVYIPNGAKGPVPAFVGLSFAGNHAVSTEKDVPLPLNYEEKIKGSTRRGTKNPEEGRGREAKSWPIELALSRGYAVATAWYFDIEPDIVGGWQKGLRAAVAKDGPSPRWDAEKSWSAVGAWAWGLSRALDYLQTDKAIDGRKVAVLGHSRLGKTSLWAGASDPRFAIVISNDSGEGGAALAKRNFGETIATMEVSFPFWFCAKHWTWVGKLDEMPLDQHMVVALVAPRPVYIASASKDTWADPKGEFLAGKAAEPVYALFGKKGLEVAEWPAINAPVGDTIGYHLREGEHAMLEYDWTQYLNFADRHFGRK